MKLQNKLTGEKLNVVKKYANGVIMMVENENGELKTVSSTEITRGYYEVVEGEFEDAHELEMSAKGYK